MSDMKYDKPRETVCSWEFAEGLMYNENIVVLLAIPAHTEDDCVVTYWDKDTDTIPPWIIDRKAA